MGPENKREKEVKRRTEEYEKVNCSKIISPKKLQEERKKTKNGKKE